MSYGKSLRSGEGAGLGVARPGLSTPLSATSLSVKGAAFRKVRRLSLEQYGPSSVSFHKSPAPCEASTGLGVLLLVVGAEVRRQNRSQATKKAAGGKGWTANEPVGGEEMSY